MHAQTHGKAVPRTSRRCLHDVLVMKKNVVYVCKGHLQHPDCKMKQLE